MSRENEIKIEGVIHELLRGAVAGAALLWLFLALEVGFCHLIEVVR